jgi:nucleoside-diphosphate-sugar epimerase
LYLLNRGTRGVDIPGAKVLTCDIADPGQTDSALKSHTWDVVVNWIAYVESEVDRDIKFFRGKTRQYVFISTASAYQKPPTHPIITESTPLYNPYWQYSRNKIACEERLNRAYREVGFPITVVRPSLTYDTVIPLAIGGWTEYTAIDRMKTGRSIIVHGDGTSLWTVTHAEDFAKGFAGLLGHAQAIGHAFQITSDEILTWNQIYSAVAEAAGCDPNIVHIPSEFIARIEPSLEGSLVGDKSASVIFDNSKIKKFVPGFVCTIPFTEGIRRTLRWFEADPKRQIVKKETNEMMDRIIKAYGHS